MALVEWVNQRPTPLHLVSYQRGVARRQSEAYSGALSPKYARISACPRSRYFGFFMCPNPWARPAGCMSLDRAVSTGVNAPSAYHRGLNLCNDLLNW